MRLNEKVTIDGKDVDVWPEGQEVRALDEKGLVLRTDFDDADVLDAGLRLEIEARLADPKVRAQRSRSLGGNKLYRLETWESLAAKILNARACELFKRAVKAEKAVIDMGWANIYGDGDYIMAHSHIRSQGSVLYMLDEGESDPDDKLAGAFGIIDPRYPPCCKIAQHYMTNPFCPILSAGSMLVFPSSLVHGVNPYRGKRPRITFSWNINQAKLEGDTLEMLRQGDVG
ncbi:MAG: putative 2OG-Fe(II) oxygenase [Kiloniellales bacterium]|nr:putative 2OG-Fe(II) oxygenase [Kiloniellales bacterium]